MQERTVIVIDPVCGMTIDAGKAIWTDHGGQTYYFCDPACADTFRDEPERWTIDVSTTSED